MSQLRLPSPPLSVPAEQVGSLLAVWRCWREGEEVKGEWTKPFGDPTGCIEEHLTSAGVLLTFAQGVKKDGDDSSRIMDVEAEKLI